MTKFALIDRDTGEFFSYISRESGNITNTPDEQRVHVPIQRMPLPQFDQETEKLIPDNQARPLPFSQATRWILDHVVERLTLSEQVARKDPTAELLTAVLELKGTGASVDQLIDALTGGTGKAGRIAGRPI